MSFYATLKDILNLHTPSLASQSKTAFDFSFTTEDGKLFELSRFRGRALLVVNSASECMFTPQYKGLQELQQEYGEKGLVVIAVPSNDFGRQENFTNREIRQFCRKHYQPQFLITDREKVRGKYAHPFYVWAADMLGGAAAPKWNFHKYLVGPDGRLVDFFLPFTHPTSSRLKKAVEEALPKGIL